MTYLHVNYVNIIVYHFHIGIVKFSLPEQVEKTFMQVKIHVTDAESSIIFTPFVYF